MLDKLNQLTESHGELKAGRGMVSGVIALSLAILCFLGVLAFHWPEYLTTPQLRKSYNVDVLRQVMYWSLGLSDRQWPVHYGVLGDSVPNGFWQQVKFPCTWKG
jgi:hypothetical protein